MRESMPPKDAGLPGSDSNPHGGAVSREARVAVRLRDCRSDAAADSVHPESLQAERGKLPEPGPSTAQVIRRKRSAVAPEPVLPMPPLRFEWLERIYRRLFGSVTRLICLSFVLVILIGAILLKLPVATRSGISIGFLSALFTATSATCVTGLVIGDTALLWSTFGQSVILCLIQIGGLGLITVTTFFMVAAKRKMSLKTMLAMQESVGSDTFSGAGSLVKRIVLVTLSCELIGGLLLVWRYAVRMPLTQALRCGLFQGVSAFCNAGFDLCGDFSGPTSSLTAFNDDPIILLTTALLVIIGGLGFVVWDDLLNLRKKKRLSFHSRLVLIMTGVLLLVGTVLFMLIEWRNTAPQALGSLPAAERPAAAFFQSVTWRTAGFNSLDQGSLTAATKLIGLLMMFIGAGPASTGGGIKVTTQAILLGTVSSYLHGREQITLLRHRLAAPLVQRAIVIIFAGFSIIFTGVLLICFFERGALQNGSFNVPDIIYEVTSGFGTVGLSAMGTANLSPGSLMVLVFTMFLGRVGPASFAIGLTFHQSSRQRVIYPDGKTFVG